MLNTGRDIPYLQAATCSFVYYINISSANNDFDDFLKISGHCLKILQNMFIGHTKVSEHFLKITDSKICKDNRRLPKTSEEDLKMF